MLAGDTVLVMGEVPRVTEFEKGFPPGRLLVDGQWQPDPWMWDDRGVVIKVKGKGLVLLSGCAHLGIVNNVRYAQELTGGKEPIYAVLGGFHLAGEEFEPTIESTVAAIKGLNPAMVVPSHCTGCLYRLYRNSGATVVEGHPHLRPGDARSLRPSRCGPPLPIRSISLRGGKEKI